MAFDATRAKSIFLAASEISDPAERNDYLNRECGDDADLRGRVVALLRANEAVPQSEEESHYPTRGLVSSDPPTGTVGADSARPTADPSFKDEHSGTVVAGKYTLVELIGEGGMGSVWRARQTEPVRRFVAVKLIKVGMDSRQVLMRFEAERQDVALMDHPNIAKDVDRG